MLIWAPAFTTSKVGKNGLYYKWHPIWCWRLPDKQDVIKFDVLRENTEGLKWWYHPATKPLFDNGVICGEQYKLINGE